MDEFIKDNPQDRYEVERRAHRRLTGAILFPIAFFPMLSMLTYNWRDISWLNTPPLTPSANLIGVVGAWFVFVGYSIFGLALWVVPVFVLIYSAVLIYGKVDHILRRVLWTFLFMTALCCLIQLGSSTIFDPTLERLNLKPNAGGAIGYALMTCLLARWFSPVGGGILMLSIMLFAFVMIVGIRNFFSALGHLTGWWSARQRRQTEAMAESIATAERVETAAEREKRLQHEVKEAARRAKEEAKRIREEERRVSDTTPALDDTMPAKAPPTQTQAAARPAPEPKRPSAALQTPKAPAKNVPLNVEKPNAYPLPGLDLLNPIPKGMADHGNIRETEERLVETLARFNVPVEIVGTTPGPVVTKYELRPDPNIKVERISALQRNLQMALEAKNIRVEAPIPGKNAVGIEIQNRKARAVTFREILEGSEWAHNKMEIPLVLGKDVAGNDLIYDLTKAPHLLVAGATGAGKSVCLNSILCGLLMSRTPEQLRLILVDPKRVEFTSYNDLPHLLVPVINDPRKVSFGLRWALVEMDRRYKMLQKVNCRNIVAFNERPKQGDLFSEEPPLESVDDTIPERLPYIVIVADEMADIMATVGKEVEPAIARLTSLSRAVGIHLILATQRPSVDVITGVIKANVPGRIAFKVSQSTDSRTILDSPGAEELIGKGDMLFLKEGSTLMRAQGAWVADEEIARIVEFVKAHTQPCYDQALVGKLDRIKEADLSAELDHAIDEHSGDEPSDESADGEEVNEGDDPMVRKALEVIRLQKRASTSLLQRRLGIGYTRAARIMDILEARGIVAPQGSSGAGAREILVDLEAIIPIHPVFTDGTEDAATDENAVFTETDEAQEKDI